MRLFSKIPKKIEHDVTMVVFEKQILIIVNSLTNHNSKGANLLISF